MGYEAVRRKHTPINTVNELKANPDSEHFEYDGGGFVIENLNAPLFGNVSGALIKNVNIRNSRIESEEYCDYGFIVCNAYNYHYKIENSETVYVTGETKIQHCTVSHSAINVQYPKREEEQTTTATVVTAPPVTPPDVVEFDENNNPIVTTAPLVIKPTKLAEHCIGAISGNGGEITDCYVTDFGIYCNIDSYFLYCGGISGKPANVTNCGVYFMSAQGNIFHAGGIVGSAMGTRAYDAKNREIPDCYGGNILGCTARNILLQAEYASDGIAGEAATDGTSPMIANCYANELSLSSGTNDSKEQQKPTKEGVVGGIIALDGSGKNGHYIIDCVSLADYSVIGKGNKSTVDESVRQAPAYAFYQQNILTVINRNTVNPANPNEIFTGNFMFGENGEFGDQTGSLPYPSPIKDLFEKTIVSGG